MIRIDKLRIDVSFSNEEIADLRSQFQKNDYIRLPNLIDPKLLEELYSQIEIANWENRTHDGIGVELCLNDPGLVSIINFLFNDHRFFRAIQTITDCQTIGCFQGRIYRMIPNSGHYDSWHTDIGEDRLIALSLNLGKDPYEGGTLQLQQRKTPGPIIEASNLHFGQAILFRLSNDLKHRVTNVVGTTAKTAFAGWFKSSPDLSSTLTELSQLNRV